MRAPQTHTSVAALQRPHTKALPSQVSNLQIRPKAAKHFYASRSSQAPGSAQAPRPFRCKYMITQASTCCTPVLLLRAHYTGRLVSNGRVFDSSYERGRPLTFRIGAGEVIR